MSEMKSVIVEIKQFATSLPHSQIAKTEICIEAVQKPPDFQSSVVAPPHVFSICTVRIEKSGEQIGPSGNLLSPCRKGHTAAMESILRKMRLCELADLSRLRTTAAYLSARSELLGGRSSRSHC
jgi:hypothetical protein